MEKIMENRLYEKVRIDLINRIENREYLPGDKLESEDELCVRYSVSKVTLRKALSELMLEKYIDSRPRIGYFVKQDEHDRFVLGFSIDSIIASDITSETISGVVDFRQENCDMEYLNGTHIEKKYFSNDTCVAFQQTDISYRHRISDSGDTSSFIKNASLLLDSLESFSLRQEMTVEAVLADAMMEERLECFENDPIMKFTRSFYDRYDRIFAVSCLYVPADELRLKAFNK